MILGGKMVSVFLTVLGQSIILLLAGRLLFGIDWGGVALVALLTLDTALVSAGLAVFLVSLMRTPTQAGAITSGVFVTLGLLGGNFVGSAPPGGFFSVVRRFTPNGWLLEGWTKISAAESGILLQLIVALLSEWSPFAPVLISGGRTRRASLDMAPCRRSPADCGQALLFSHLSAARGVQLSSASLRRPSSSTLPSHWSTWTQTAATTHCSDP